MRADVVPCRFVRPANLLGPQAVCQPLVVPHSQERPLLEALLLRVSEAALPGRLAVLTLLDGFLPLRGGQVLRCLSCRETLAATPHALVVHGHELEEYLAVAVRVLCRGQEQPQEQGADKHKRLAPVPLAERIQGLAVPGLALFVALL